MLLRAWLLARSTLRRRIRIIWLTVVVLLMHLRIAVVVVAGGVLSLEHLGRPSYLCLFTSDDWVLTGTCSGTWILGMTTTSAAAPLRLVSNATTPAVGLWVCLWDQLWRWLLLRCPRIAVRLLLVYQFKFCLLLNIRRMLLFDHFWRLWCLWCFLWIHLEENIILIRTYHVLHNFSLARHRAYIINWEPLRQPCPSHQ